MDKLFKLKSCEECKGTGDAHHQDHYYDCGDCLGTGYEEPQGRIINLELMLNEHKMALKSSDAHNNDLAQKLEIAWEQRDRLAEALKELLTTGDNGYGTPTDKAWEMAEQAFAAVKGGQP